MKPFILVILLVGLTFHPIRAAEPTGEGKVSVPMIDARTKSVDGVHGFSIFQSDNSIVVAFFGKDRQLFNDTKEAVREALAAGEPVRGMVFGPPTETSYVEIFANNQRITSRGLTTNQEVKTAIIHGSEIVQSSLP